VISAVSSGIGRSVYAPISLSDNEMAAILSAAEPLAVQDRGAFLETVARELSGRGELGDRVVRDVQRRLSSRST
jgi:hypothetical protein